MTRAELLAETQADPDFFASPQGVLRDLEVISRRRSFSERKLGSQFLTLLELRRISVMLQRLAAPLAADSQASTRKESR